MLCSPLSFTLPTPHWLDRLHSSLDQDPSTSPPTPPPPCSPPPPPPPVGPTGLAAAIADLFHMGGGAPADRFRRSSRKQPNPRSFAPPGAEEASSAAKRPRRRPRRSAPAPAPTPRDKDARRIPAAKKRKRAGAAAAGNDEESGRFSRMDVVVIDTSAEEAVEWKSAKIIFRKGTAWKVRDKKLWNLARKRRRRLVLPSEKRARDEEIVGEAKTLPIEGFRLPDSVRDVDNHESKRNSREVGLKDPILISEERLRFPRSSRGPTRKEHLISHSRNRVGKATASFSSGDTADAE